MPSLKMLDSLIVMVGVILVLSLIVQSLQSALKKLLKIKSRQIEDSLVDLFENTLGMPDGKTQSMTASSPLLRMIFRKPATFDTTPAVKALFDAVASKFRDIGRVAQSGSWILDSLSKDDLVKVLARVAPDTLLPDFVTKLTAVCTEVDDLKNTLETIQGETLSGQASAKLATLRQAIDPLINDVATIYKSPAGTTGQPPPKQIEPALLVGDAMRLREIKYQDVLGILNDLQKQLDEDLVAARAAGNAQDQVKLETASAGLKKVATQLTALNAKFDQAIAPLRNRLQSVETWFDTVMQSFEERYTRGMKTWALVLSLIVVVLLNANFFKIAHQILAADPATLEQQVQAVQKLETNLETQNQKAQKLDGDDRADQRTAAAAAAPQGTEPQATGTEVAPQGTKPASSGPKPADSTAATPGKLTDPAKLTKIVKQARDDAQQGIFSYNGLGFGPLIWQQSSEDIFPKSPWETLAGWLVMTMLLSAGAPFWEDTLESLFGVKNLLRKNTATKNVEQASGEGNPKAS